MGRILQAILIAALMLAPAAVAADGASASVPTIKIVDSKPAAASSSSAQASISASEVLPGNGGRAGYVLGHGNVIPNSEWIFVGVKHAIRNKDYTMDYAAGTIFFMEPVRTIDSVRVDYRYSDKAKSERSISGPGSMMLSFGNGLQMNMVYSYRTADTALGFGAQDVLTYGVNTTSKFGGSSSLTSMAYVSTPQETSRFSLNAAPVAAGSKPAPKLKKDRLLLQNADLGLGKVRLKLGFQDVGESFAGFNSLRDSKAAPADMLNALEKEKGIQRMSFGAEIPSGKDSGFNFSMDQIKDKQDDITNQAFSYTNSGLKFNYSTREVGKQFKRFNDLREADRGQMAAEVGIKRTNYGMQFATGFTSDKKQLWSGLSFGELQSDNGSLSYKSMNIGLGKVSLQADVRTMDPEFNRMAALNDEERTRMALIARRQFNPKAQTGDVTAQDKAQLNQEAGINRSSALLEVDGGPAMRGFLSFGKWNSLKGGDISRTAVNLESNRFSVFFNHQTIANTFNRIGSLQEIERLYFGNEYGMARSEMGGTVKLMGGDLALRSATVTDHQGASVVRNKIDFKNNRLKLRANFQNIDSKFSRILDLSDADRNLLVQEKGFQRSDYWLNFQATRDINIDSYFYDSTNATAGQTRGQVTHKFSYTPRQGRQITLLRDNYSYVSEAGNLSSYARQKFTFDNKFNLLGGLTFNYLSDQNTVQEGSADPVTTTIDQKHLESNQSAKNSFVIDTLNIDYGNGKFENTKAFGFKARSTKSLALVGSYGITDRDANTKSEKNNSLGVEWSLNKDLKFTLGFSDRTGGPKGSQRARQFSLVGPIAKRFLCFDNIVLGQGTGSNTTMLTGKQVGCNNAFKLSAGFMGGNIVVDNSDKLNPQNGIYYSSHLMMYESSKDPKKWYHFTWFKQDLTTPAGAPALKRNYALDMRMSPSTSFTLTSYFGKDGQNGTVLPVGGKIFKISSKLNSRLTLIGDYTRDVNNVTNRRARIYGLGLQGTLSSNSAFEVYYGRGALTEGNISDHDNVYRLKFDRKIDAEHYITFTAQRRCRVDQATINPNEGNTTARIDFMTVFD